MTDSSERIREAAFAVSDDRAAPAIRATLKSGGSAADAGVVAVLAMAAIDPLKVGLGGSLSAVHFDAATRQLAVIDGAGRLPDGLAPFQPVPASPFGAPMAALPRAIPALGELHGKHGRQSWASLCESAAAVAEDGRAVTLADYASWLAARPLLTATDEGRVLFFDGELPLTPGSRFRNPALAAMLKALGDNGPRHAATGAWAQAFRARAEAMGWRLAPDALSADPPRWQNPLIVTRDGHSFALAAPPQRQGAIAALTLGALAAAAVDPDSADGIYATAHILRRARIDSGYIGADGDEASVSGYLDADYHRQIAAMIQGSRPRADMRQHYALLKRSAIVAQSGLPTFTTGTDVLVTSSSVGQTTPGMACTIVDDAGNWLALSASALHGGIPGQVVGGVLMLGSTASVGHLRSAATARLAGGRIQMPSAAALMLEGGTPRLGIAGAGADDDVLPQILNRLARKTGPEAAFAAPRTSAVDERYAARLESAHAPETLEALAILGLQVAPLKRHDAAMGNFVACWSEGALSGASDARGSGTFERLA